MSSNDIADLTGKQHYHVIRDIKDMLTQLKVESALEGGNPNMDGLDFKGFFVEKREDNRQTKAIHLNRFYTEVLITGYDVVRRAAVIKRWHDLETGAASSASLPPAATHHESQMNLLNEIGRAFDLTDMTKAERITLLASYGKVDVADILSPVAKLYTALELPGCSRPTDSATEVEIKAEEEIYHSVTSLLKMHNISVSAGTFNQLLGEAGYLTRKWVGTYGYWSVSEKGKKFGRDSSKSSSTTPRWKESTFHTLLKELDVI